MEKIKKIGIITDSNCGINQAEAEEMGIMVLPMPFYIGDNCYYEEVSLTREEFFRRLNGGERVSTSQPSPESVMKIWREGLERFEQIVYIPMSSGLSGSCEAAKLLSEKPEFKDKVFVVDNGRVSTPMKRSILDAMELVVEGYDAGRIKEILEKAAGNMSIYIAVETLEFLKRGGRVTVATATIGSLLNIKPVLRLGVGLLEAYKKSRGMKKAKKDMLEAIKNDLKEKYKEYYERGEVYLLAASSADEETTEEWVREIKEYFPGMEVLSGNLSFGICCHIGEGGLGIGLSCRPER